MSKLSMRPEMRDFIIKLDKLIREGVIEPVFDFVIDGSHLITHGESSKKVVEAFGDGKNDLKKDNFEWLKNRGYLSIEYVSGSLYTFAVEQSLHDLVDRDFEVEAPHPIVNVTAQQATVNITRADAVNLINNNVQLADALDSRLRDIISAEHAFIFDAINELRTAVDNASKQTALQKVYGAAAHINDAYGLIQIAIVIASLIRH